MIKSIILTFHNFITSQEILDIDCVCSAGSFGTFLFHILLIGLIVALMIRARATRKDFFFIFLLVGLVVLGTSEFLDFWHNILVNMEGYMVFIPELDNLTQLFRIAGYGIILGLILKLRKEFS